jgi:Fe-S cluster biogenesis protein NfuA
MNYPDDLNHRVTKVLTEEIAPLLQMDGGQIELIDFEEGVVRLRLKGSCGACPTSIMAVILGMEEELRRRIPEIEYLELVP